MNIAIIDDEKNYQIQISHIIHKKYNDIDIFLYNPEEKLDYNTLAQYDIIFLDIEMPNINGIVLAEKIKEINNDVLIIYVSSYSNYITSALRTMPFQYILKPIDEKVLSSELERAVEHIYKKNAIFSIKVYGGEKKIQISKMYYLEYLNRKIEIHTESEIISTYGTIKDIVEELRAYDFIKCHASFIVNLGAIESIKGYDIKLKNGVTIPVSKKHLSDTREMFAKYIAKESM